MDVDGPLKLQDPLEIELDGSARSLLSEIGESIRRLEPLRPFSPDTVARIQTELLPRRIVATLNMEGISATQRQTLLIMDAMKLREVPNRGNQEVSNALEANQFIIDSVELGVELSESVIREINKNLLHEVRQDGGQFRSAPVELIGAPFSPALPSDIPDLINQLCGLFAMADSCNPIIQAAWLHAQFTMIHPFSDGNGRTGRLLQDFSLIRRGLLPVGIPSSERDGYYVSLEAADKGNWNPIVEMLSSLQLSTINETEAIATEPERRSAWIQRLSQAASQKESETRKKRYLIWKICIENFVHELTTVVNELNLTSSPIMAVVKNIDVPSIEIWESLLSKATVAPTRLLSVVFDVGGESIYEIVFYIRRHESLPVDLFEPQADLMGVYLTGVDPRVDKQPSIDEFNDQNVRLREFAFVGSNLYVYVKKQQGVDWDCQDDLSVGELVEDLFEDVFLRKGGINN